MPNFSLRYDATFKVSKFESSLFYKIVLHVVVVLHVCKKTTTCIGLQLEQIFLSYVISSARVSCCKKNWTNFLLHCTSTFMSSKSVSQVFKTLFQTGAINSPGACEEIFSPFGTQDVTQNFKPLPRGNQLGYFWRSLGFWATQ